MIIDFAPVYMKLTRGEVRIIEISIVICDRACKIVFWVFICRCGDVCIPAPWRIVEAIYITYEDHAVDVIETKGTKRSTLRSIKSGRNLKSPLHHSPLRRHVRVSVSLVYRWGRCHVQLPAREFSETGG